MSFCHMKREIADNKEYFPPQMTIFVQPNKKCGIPDATESYSFQSVFTTFCTEINH